MLIYFIILAAAATRFIPHLPNAAPITALAIFSAAHLSKRQALAITLSARLVSDFFLGFFSWPLMVAVYASHSAGVFFGLWIKQSCSSNTRKWLKITGSSFGTALLFFAVTNFAFLYPNYPHNVSGILLAYYNGLPFLRGTLLGDVVYTVGLFGAYEAIKRLITLITFKRNPVLT